uniref:Uncharacterized protein n=1 Tax=Avena sativa TaxID=4498 RepID=A0ACD5ZL45_AVESA
MPPPHRHALLLAALLLLLLAASAAAQPDEREPWYRRNDGGAADDDDGGVMPGARKQTSFSAPMVVLLVALIATFFFIGFFSIYIRQCGRGGSPARSVPAAALLALSRQEQQQQPDRQLRGLDPDVLASFPTMTYAEARALRDGSGKGGDAALECAVCLSEFEDEEKLRLLPECSHAFHPDCIGEWLAAHVTCPVCRRSLVPPEEKPADTAAEADGSRESEEQRRPEVAIVMNREGSEDEERRELERIGSLRRAVRSRSRSGRPFSRAHSTGHSLSARLDGDLERFTLRLPEQVRREMMAAAGEESLRRTVGRSARIGRSDRWPSFIARTFSSSRVPFWAASRRAPSDVEAAGSTTTTPATIHEKTTADASAGSAKGSLRFDCLGGGVTAARVSSAAGDSEDEPEEEKAIVRRV